MKKPKDPLRTRVLLRRQIHLPTWPIQDIVYMVSGPDTESMNQEAEAMWKDFERFIKAGRSSH
jgi:hypothetical protein